jgi:hypothetical protein
MTSIGGLRARSEPGTRGHALTLRPAHHAAGGDDQELPKRPLTHAGCSAQPFLATSRGPAPCRHGRDHGAGRPINGEAGRRTQPISYAVTISDPKSFGRRSGSISVHPQLPRCRRTPALRLTRRFEEARLCADNARDRKLAVACSGSTEPLFGSTQVLVTKQIEMSCWPNSPRTVSALACEHSTAAQYATAGSR